MFNIASPLILGLFGAAYAGSALAAESRPDFAPNPSVGWVAFAPQFIPPPNGPGPVQQDPAHPRISNDDYRATGAQPSFPIGDLKSPILLPWAREQMRAYNERVLSGNRPSAATRAAGRVAFRGSCCIRCSRSISCRRRKWSS